MSELLLSWDLLCLKRLAMALCMHLKVYCISLVCLCIYICRSREYYCWQSSFDSVLFFLDVKITNTWERTIGQSYYYNNYISSGFGSTASLVVLFDSFVLLFRRHTSSVILKSMLYLDYGYLYPFGDKSDWLLMIY